MEYTNSDIDRFWSKIVVLSDEECWNWIGGKHRQGYGKFYIKDATLGSHRVSWEIHYGKIPDGLFVCHKCDNVSCCNPYHLFLGTAKDNVKDMVNKGRHKNGAKLQIDDVRKIKNLLKTTSMSQSKIASLFGVQQPAISFIKSNSHWKGIS